MEIQFYDVTRQRKVNIPLEQIKKALFKRTARNGKVRVHYMLVTQ